MTPRHLTARELDYLIGAVTRDANCPAADRTVAVRALDLLEKERRK